jgi:hypothetical protein
MNKGDSILSTKESAILIIMFGLLLACFLIFPITDKGTTAVAAISTLLSTTALVYTNKSFLLAKKSSEHAEESLKLTKSELDLSKKEFEFSVKNKRKEHIQEALEKFYLPLQRIFTANPVILSGEEKSLLIMWSENCDTFNRLAHYSYLAEPSVRSLYFACAVDSGFDQNKLEESLSYLLDQVNRDIIDYQNQLKD